MYGNCGKGRANVLAVHDPSEPLPAWSHVWLSRRWRRPPTPAWPSPSSAREQGLGARCPGYPSCDSSEEEHGRVHTLAVGENVRG